MEEVILSVADSAASLFHLMFWPLDDNIPPERRVELFSRFCNEAEDKIRLSISYQQFNALLTEHDQPTVSTSFYEFFFPNLASGVTLNEFKDRVFQYMKVVIWKFGNLQSGLQELGSSDSLQSLLADVPIRGAHPINSNDLASRSHFNMIRDLSPSQRQMLGYLVGQGIEQELEQIRDIGRKNTLEYLFLDELDVYVATSMRDAKDFERFHALTHEIFESKELSELKIRYFDPTLSYCDEPVLKGLLESLMLRRARLTLYVAGEGDTFGKDSECASTLAQGKPVVVYVESPPAGASSEVIEKLEKRAKIFQGAHPLSLQVSIRTGVPRGLLVVRSVEACRILLRQLILHEVDTYLDKDSSGYVLRERATKCRLGIAPSNANMSRAFQNYYYLATKRGIDRL